MRPLLLGIGFSLAAALLGCKRGSQPVLKDTESRVFSAKCSAQGACELSQKSGPGQGLPVSLSVRGRLIAVCPGSVGDPPAAVAECRPLLCESDNECPPGQGLAHGTCVNGLCIEPSRDVTADDSVLLCLSGTGLGRSSPVQVERFALGLNCGTPCKVPRTCRQP
ncbi:MAG TPA: hypothetical protein VGP93_19485 [Polyangiaceae bacterium]|nr:hypothetical protein [Polyangiaceae bacterium]